MVTESGNCWSRPNGRRDNPRQSIVEDLNGSIELGAGNGERRSEGQDVALGDLEIQSAGQTVVHHLFGLIRRPDDLALPVVPEFDTHQES